MALHPLRLAAALCLALASASAQEPPAGVAAPPAWEKLPTEPFRGKQDDVVFVDERHGWYGNGDGKLFGTRDGGDTWELLWHQPGTFVRALAFVDAQVGVLGNIGTDYFPGVTDRVPLYRSTDGGRSWSPAALEGDPLTGVCALQVLRAQVINAGVLEERVRLFAAGRVGGPAAFAVSDDLGATWRVRDLSSACGMVLDVHFFDLREGLLAAASSHDVAQSRALVLRTSDGGETWQEAWRGERPFELTWKLSFPERDTGFVTIQSYDPDPSASRRCVGRSTDGGRSWAELPLVDDHAVRAFGVAFLDARTGWVGAVPGGFRTDDGGATWRREDFGPAVNKLRVVRGAQADTVFALGTGLQRLRLPHPPR